MSQFDNLPEQRAGHSEPEFQPLTLERLKAGAAILRSVR